MAIDNVVVGEIAARLMDTLSEQYGDEANLEAVALVVAVNRGSETVMHHSFGDGEGQPLAVYKGLGMLEFVKNSLT